VDDVNACVFSQCLKATDGISGEFGVEEEDHGLVIFLYCHSGQGAGICKWNYVLLITDAASSAA
jgi:hypothetical protein